MELEFWNWTYLIICFSGDKKQTNAERFYSSLDELMFIMFVYIHTNCWEQEKSTVLDCARNKPDVLNWKMTQQIYRDLLAAFDTIILPTHASCHVQFLMFYTCSFKQTLSDAFLDFLWKKFQSPNTSTVIRQNCAAYISSFLARANYISVATVKTVLDLICAWIHRYIDGQDIKIHAYMEMGLHGAFHAACQSVFYVFCFRHEELMKMHNGCKWLHSLNFQRMVTCRLNPLHVCLPMIVNNFASITRALQLAYCYTIIEHNKRNTIPVAVESSTQVVMNLDSFFPFDPYLLEKSQVFVNTSTLYREYKMGVEEPKKDENEEEDDFLHLSMSPGFKHAPLTMSHTTMNDIVMMSL